MYQQIFNSYIFIHEDPGMFCLEETFIIDG